MSELEAVREGHQSEVLLSVAEEFPADLCFTLVFHGRQGNLDLVADSPEEAQAWIQGVRKLIHKVETMDEKERLDQYPSVFWSRYLSVRTSLYVSLTNISGGSGTGFRRPTKTKTGR